MGQKNKPASAANPDRERAARPARHVTAAIPTAVYRKGCRQHVPQEDLATGEPEYQPGRYADRAPARITAVGRSRWPRAHRIDSQPMAARAGPQASGLPMDRIWV